MDEERARILEEQLDALAGKVTTLEEQMNTLVEALLRPGVGETLHLTSADLASLKFPKKRHFAALDHGKERDKQVRQAARDAELDRLISEREERERQKARGL